MCPHAGIVGSGRTRACRERGPDGGIRRDDEQRDRVVRFGGMSRAVRLGVLGPLEHFGTVTDQDRPQSRPAVPEPGRPAHKEVRQVAPGCAQSAFRACPEMSTLVMASACRRRQQIRSGSTDPVVDRAEVPGTQGASVKFSDFALGTETLHGANLVVYHGIGVDPIPNSAQGKSLESPLEQLLRPDREPGKVWEFWPHPTILPPSFPWFATRLRRSSAVLPGGRRTR